MINNTNIPDEIIAYLRIILYCTFHIKNIEENEITVIRYIRPEFLKKMIGDQKDDYIHALNWALKNPVLEYNKVLPDIRFSNDECLKLLAIFLLKIKLL